MSAPMDDRGLALCKALGLDPSVVIADTCVVIRQGYDDRVRTWAEYRQIVNGAPERDDAGELVTHTIPLPNGLPMTAGPSVRDRAAEVLRAFVPPFSNPTFAVDALAAAGLLAEEDGTHGLIGANGSDVTLAALRAALLAPRGGQVDMPFTMPTDTP